MKTKRFYVDCLTCGGRQAAKLERGQPWIVMYQQQRIDVPIGPLARGIGQCAACGEKSFLIQIAVANRFGTKAPGCDGRCLNGKTSCDCQCNGRCHGAGRCSCPGAAA